MKLAMSEPMQEKEHIENITYIFGSDTNKSEQIFQKMYYQDKQLISIEMISRALLKVGG